MSEGTCDVSIGGYDGDPAEFSSITKPIARKAHTCCECKEPIPAGARYVSWVGKWEGTLETWKFCAACYEITNEFSDGGISIGVLWDELETNWHDGAHLQACLNRLTSATAKQLMARKWRAWKGL